jgi:hypothetical protein
MASIQDGEGQEKEFLDLGDYDSGPEPSAVAHVSSKTQFQNALAVASGGNRSISDVSVEELLRGLTTDADDDVIITYREGKRVKYDSDAISVDIGLDYVPGADRANVNTQEFREISGEEASQKTSMWRVLTAGNMLMELEVQRDLKIKIVSIASALLFSGTISSPLFCRILFIL